MKDLYTKLRNEHVSLLKQVIFYLYFSINLEDAFQDKNLIIVILKSRDRKSEISFTWISSLIN